VVGGEGERGLCGLTTLFARPVDMLLMGSASIEAGTSFIIMSVYGSATCGGEYMNAGESEVSSVCCFIIALFAYAANFSLLCGTLGG